MDSTLTSTGPQQDASSLNRARRAALGSFAGAVVDWYDFLLYGITAALVFNREFFPQVSPAMGTLAAFATFGVGFLFRPLGGVIFGHFGDRLGRKRMLMLTVWMMGIATALIGIIPSFDTIGWWAPVLLVTLRAIQGFAVGGEWGGAALLSVESAPKNKKAFYSSGVQVGYGVGLLLSTGLVLLISSQTTDEQFLSWGWRIPFLFSIVLVGAGFFIRMKVGESPEFLETKSRGEIVKNPDTIATAIRIGNPLESGTLNGPLIDNASFDAFEKAIAAAKAEGGKVLVGGVRASMGYCGCRTIDEMRTRAQFVEQHQIIRRHLVHDGHNRRHMPGEGGQALLDGLLVANIGEHLPKHRQLRPQIRRDLQARLRHQRQQPDRFQRDRLAARVRAGDNQRREVLAHPQI